MVANLNRSRLVRLDIARPRDEKASGGNIFAAPWLALFTSSLAAALATVALGWLMVAGPILLAQTTMPTSNLIAAVTFATHFWLSAHGAPLELTGFTSTLVPTGVTLLLGLVLTLGAALAARQAWETKLSSRRWLVFLVSAGTTGGLYLGIIFLTLAIIGFPGQLARTVIGVVLTGLFFAGLGAWLGTGRPNPFPRLSGVLFGAGVVHLGLLIGAALALVVAVGRGAERISTLEQGLGVSGLGSLLLGVLYLAFLPTLLIWAESYLLGGGFALGTDSFVAPGATHIGVLPGVPLFGAVTDSVTPATWGWLLVAAVAASFGAWVSVRDYPSSSVFRCAIRGAAATGVALVGFLGLAVVSRGDLGLHRMVGFGPRLFELLIIPTPMFLLLGLLVGAVTAYRRRSAGLGAATELQTVDEDTISFET